MREPKNLYALVQDETGATYMNTDPGVQNGWRQVNNGYGVDLTWGEVLHFSPTVSLLFEGVTDPSLSLEDVDLEKFYRWGVSEAERVMPNARGTFGHSGAGWGVRHLSSLLLGDKAVEAAADAMAESNGTAWDRMPGDSDDVYERDARAALKGALLSILAREGEHR